MDILRRDGNLIMLQNRVFAITYGQLKVKSPTKVFVFHIIGHGLDQMIH